MPRGRTPTTGRSPARGGRQVALRVSSDEHATLETAAERARCSVQHYLLAAVALTTQQDVRVARQVRALCAAYGVAPEDPGAREAVGLLERSLLTLASLQAPEPDFTALVLADAQKASAE